MEKFNTKLSKCLMQFSDILCSEKELVEKMIYINNNINLGTDLSQEDFRIINKILYSSILLSILVEKNNTEFENLIHFLNQ